MIACSKRVGAWLGHSGWSEPRRSDGTLGPIPRSGMASTLSGAVSVWKFDYGHADRGNARNEIRGGFSLKRIGAPNAQAKLTYFGRPSIRSNASTANFLTLGSESSFSRRFNADTASRA